jgi:hypothetical protein
LRRTCSSVGVALVVGCLLWTAARADDEGRGFRLRVARSVDIEVGSERAVSLTILPKSGYVISRDGPVSLRSQPPPGLQLRRRHLRRKDAVDPGAEAPRFELRVRAKETGSFRLPVRVRFYVCRKKACRPIERKLEIGVTVPAAAPDAGVSDDAGGQ